MSMPEMDGRETMQRIRANPQWANIPIIFLTADNSPETEAQCFDDGADEFIAKPFVPQVMQNRVSHILELYDLRQKTKELSKEDSYER